MKTCLLLLFSLFDLSDSSKVACAVIGSGLQSAHMQISPKGHNIASHEQRASNARARLGQGPEGEAEPQRGPRRSRPRALLSRAPGYASSCGYGYC